MSKFWKWAEVSGGVVYLIEVGVYITRRVKTEAYSLPDWVKAKMAMLDLMRPLDRLPCDSYRHLLSHPKNGVGYKIMEDEDEGNN